MLVPCADGPNRSPLPLRGAFGRGCSRCSLVTISSPGDTALAKASWPSLAEIIQSRKWSRTPRSVDVLILRSSSTTRSSRVLSPEIPQVMRPSKRVLWAIACTYPLIYTLCYLCDESRRRSSPVASEPSARP